jgi:hypothetical protein
MKARKLSTLLAVVLIFGSAIALFGFMPAAKPFETQICYGPSVKTDDLHNAVIAGPYNPEVYGKYANSWFKKYTLTVSAPPGWHFTGEPYVNCVKDDQGAFGWNNFPAARDRFYITQRTPTSITATCWAGSRSIIINLACQATKN